MPGVYNEARLDELPLPLLVSVSSNEQPSDDENSSAQDPFFEELLNLGNSDIATLSDNEEPSMTNQLHQSNDDELSQNSLDETSMNANILDGEMNMANSSLSGVANEQPFDESIEQSSEEQ